MRTKSQTNKYANKNKGKHKNKIVKIVYETKILVSQKTKNGGIK